MNKSEQKHRNEPETIKNVGACVFPQLVVGLEGAGLETSSL